MAQPETSTHRLILMPSGRRGDIREGTTVLDAARSLGVEIESICGGRLTCGKCQVALERGHFARHGITSSEDHLTPPDESERACAAHFGIDLNERRLACAARIIGDVLINVPEESQARKQVIRKEAADLMIEVAPAVRLVYVEVAEPVMGGAGDWQRVQAALAEQWGLHNITIDPLLLRDLQKTLRTGKWALTLTLWQEREVIRIEPGYVESLYGLAVDVGTTTVAGYLCDLRTGRVLATESMMNPQIRYGEDIISRITYGQSEKQGVNRLHRAIVRALNDLATSAADKAGISAAEITEMVLVGNTVMHHLFLGIDPYEIGRVPFALATYDAIDALARDFGFKALHPAARLHVLPCIAGYNGADNVGVLLAEQPNLDDLVTLVVDVGTNAEILLGNRHRMLATSSPTGPAFEGATIKHGQRAAPGAIERIRIDTQSGRVRYKVIGDSRWSDQLPEGETLRPTGICGSGIIEAVGELFLAGLIDRTGRFVPDAHKRLKAAHNSKAGELVIAGADETATGEPIVVNQFDVRQIQLAKGALYSGTRLLMDHLGVESVDRVKLAGAFGSYIDPYHALAIGMIPDIDLDRVQAVGNSAGDGARIALLNAGQRALAQQVARTVEYIETAAEPRFQEYFVDAMWLPHATDPFPYLEELINKAHQGA